MIALPIVHLAVILLLCLFFFPASVLAGTDNSDDSTQETKTVRVGYVNVPTYEEGGEGEYKTGSGYEYLQKISYYTGWKYEYVYGTFQELYQKLADGEIDLFGNLTYTDERADLFLYSTYPQGKDIYFLYTLPERTDLLSGSLDDLNGIQIGVTKDSYQETLLKSWLSQHELTAEISEFDGYASSMKALEDGEIDAIATPKLSSEDYNYATVIDIGFSEYYFAVAKGRSDLLGELNEALYEIQTGDPNYNAVLEQKYQSDMLSDTFLTEKEKDWLSEHGNTIRLGYLLDNLPFSDQNETGDLIGILSALTDSMEQNFDLHFETVPYTSHADLQAALQSGEIDAMGPSYCDYWLAEQINVIQTNSLLSTTPVLFFNSNSMTDMLNVIAVTDQSFFCPDTVKLIFPEAELLICDTQQDCLNAVKNKKANSMVATASQMSLIQQNSAAQQLMSAEISTQIDLCLYVAKENPPLATILNKGITSAGTLLSGAILSQSSYVPTYSLKNFLSAHIAAATIVIVFIIVLLLVIIFLLVRATNHVHKVNQQIVQKQQELQEALEAAESANSAKTTFLANMSHDIRTPINGILGMVDILGKNRTNPEKVTECLAKIRTSSDHLLQLINDILDLSRLESGQVVLEHVPFNLRDVGEDALTVVEQQAKEAGLRTLSEHIDGTDIWLIGSPLHYKQIMLNLYTNAIKYNKPGGLLYTNLEEYSRTDDILTLKLTVQDTGIGMTQDFIDTKLFSPFTQGENGARTTYNGIGLGMSIVKKIVEEMNGSIQVDSILGEGTTFTVLLPFEIDRSDHTKPVEEEPENTDITGVHILIAEDNDLNLEIAEYLLTDAGATLTTTVNGKQALDTFAASEPETFDLILMDIMMPVMNGLDAARAIRALDREDAKTIPIFAMTANAFSEDAKKSLDAGMNEHVAKPLDADKLIALIARYTKNK